jgi:hypothetical protein
MLLAAFAMGFALVCPVAVTPIFVQNHHSPHVDLAFVTAHVLTFTLAFSAATGAEFLTTSPIFSDPAVRNCVRLC